MKKLPIPALPLVLTVTLLAQANSGEWTGYITDSNCGKNGANKDHTAACVDKCVKGGAKVRILSEADQKAYDLDGLDKVKSLVGGRVTLKGTLNSETNTITVESAAKASQ